MNGQSVGGLAARSRRFLRVVAGGLGSKLVVGAVATLAVVAGLLVSPAGSALPDVLAGTSLSIAPATIVEGTSSGSTLVSLTITRPNAAAVECNVTAVASIGSGDTASPGDITIVNVQNALVGAGDLSRTVIPTNIVADSLDETDETFTVTIAGAPFGTTPACDVNPAAATVTVTIQDDDGPAPGTSLSIAPATIVE
jgi:hypothetical protein